MKRREELYIAYCKESGRSLTITREEYEALLRAGAKASAPDDELSDGMQAAIALATQKPDGSA
ncbi:MAG TPA: hypothetical protein VEA38_15085 [Terriglobales bacterium]|nr:hypothetical protein [Terriglobales bacterium]